jgi:exopolysaccharide production protein ExoY
MLSELRFTRADRRAPMQGSRNGRSDARPLARSETLKTFPILRAAEPALGGWRKRTFDVVVALAALVCVSPVFCVTMILATLANRGPIFYHHRRVGKNGTMFDCLKFRTMVVDADAVMQRHLAVDSAAAREWEATRKLKNDPRVTSFGWMLRITSLDELPQLLNVLRGEMSLVGPRPIVTAEIRKYGSDIQYYLISRPGVTGLWQVSGRNDVGYATRVQLDRKYVEEWSLTNDILILLKTIRVLIERQGSY